MDRMSSQTALLVIGNSAPARGRVGNGGTAPFRKGGDLPNNRKGRLNNNNTSAMIICERKINTPIIKPSKVPKTEKKPRLSPAGNKLTATARINRKIRLYIAHCRGRFVDDTGICRRFQCVCSDINRLKLNNARPKTK